MKGGNLKKNWQNDFFYLTELLSKSVIIISYGRKRFYKNYTRGSFLFHFVTFCPGILSEIVSLGEVGGGLN